MNSVNFMLQIPDISKIVYFLKICFMSTVTCYTAYKNWYYKVGHSLINSKIKFDTQLKFIGKLT